MNGLYGLGVGEIFPQVAHVYVMFGCHSQW